VDGNTASFKVSADGTVYNLAPGGYLYANWGDPARPSYYCYRVASGIGTYALDAKGALYTLTVGGELDLYAPGGGAKTVVAVNAARFSLSQTGGVMVLYRASLEADGALLVVAPDGNQNIVVNEDTSNVWIDGMSITVNGSLSASVALGAVKQILIIGGIGNDSITINPHLPSPFSPYWTGPGLDPLYVLACEVESIPTCIIGGVGNDTIGGGLGDNFIVGGTGSNTLYASGNSTTFVQFGTVQDVGNNTLQVTNGTSVSRIIGTGDYGQYLIYGPGQTPMALPVSFWNQAVHTIEDVVGQAFLRFGQLLTGNTSVGDGDGEGVAPSDPFASGEGVTPYDPFANGEGIVPDSNQAQPAIPDNSSLTADWDAMRNPYYLEFLLATQAANVPASWASDPALLELVRHESALDPTATNPTSSALGLFQMIDGTWAATGAAPSIDPYFQAIAGFRYIEATYGTPERAWAFWQATVNKDASLAPVDLQQRAAQWIANGWAGY
jgi:hypothetical protein